MAATALPQRGRIRIPIGKALLVPLSDDALVEQVRTGNERAFEVIYDRYHAGLLAFCRHMLGSTDEAEDALQQVFVSAHADLLRSKRAIALKSWLYTIARNRCVSVLRTRREQSSEQVEPSTEGLSGEVERRLELRDLMADLRDLPDEQRQALVLAEVGDLSHAEIGRVIGCEAAKVKSLIFQARSKLIESRKARQTPCAEIREQLATLSGGALRRGELKRHLKVCPGCAEFRDEVRRQRAMLAAVLPVVPSLALKRSVLAAAGISSAGGGSVGGAALVAGVAAKGGVAKLVTGCVAGALAVGGGVALHESTSGSGSRVSPPVPAGVQPPAQQRAIAPAPPPSVPAKGAPSAAPLSEPHGRSTTAHRGHHGRSLAKGHAKHGAAGPPSTMPAASSNGTARALGRAKAHRQAPAVHKPAANERSSSYHLKPRRANPVLDPASLVIPRTPPGKALGTTG